MGEQIALDIIAALKNLPGEFVIMLLSAIPLTELRATIPVAYTVMAESWAWPWWKIFLLAVAGNMIPVPFILLLLGPVSRWLSKWKLFDRFFNWLFERTGLSGWLFSLVFPFHSRVPGPDALRLLFSVYLQNLLFHQFFWVF
jgi:hypothetical protein